MEKNKIQKPEISIIIPIYNVELFLSRCLESCKSQSMENLQFVLVDDGSEDRCGEIADQYSREDSRFQVYHTENHGLSAALNYGLTKADADWIMFIDGDDWVDPHFCEIPFSAAKEHNAELVIFNYYIAMSRNKITKRNLISVRGLVSREEAVETGDVVRWNKLYHRSLFNGIRYPEGKICEDTFTASQQIYLANRIAAIPDYLYYYQTREGSLSNSGTRYFYRSNFQGGMERYENLIKNDFPEKKAEQYLFYYAEKYVSHIRPDRNDELYRKAASILDNFQSAPSEYGWKGKIKLAVWKLSPSLYHLIFFLAGEKVKE